MKDKGATMNDIACQLRAQIASSTDPDRLERLAREAEAPTVQPHHSTQAHPGWSIAARAVRAGPHWTFQPRKV